MNKKVLILLAVTVFMIASCATTKPKDSDFMGKLVHFMEEGDYDSAIALFDTLTSQEANTNQKIFLKSSILISANRLEQARSTIAVVLAREKDNAEAMFILSNVEAAAGNTKAQRALLDSVIKKEPSHIPALIELGFLSMNNKNLKNAASYFDNVTKSDPENLDALVGRASVFRLQRNSSDAEKTLSKAILYHPKSVKVLGMRGRIYRETGNLEYALKDFEEAEKYDKNNYWIIYDKGRTLLDMDKRKEALVEFERAEKINPQNFIAYVYSAGIRDDLNDYKNSLRDYQILARLKPDYYFAYEMIGLHLMRDKQYAGARDAFMMAFDGSPSDFNYAMLAVINAFHAGDKSPQLKKYLEPILKRVDKSKLDYSLLRLFYDFSGDNDVLRRIFKETDMREKAKGLFYLASYYDVLGREDLAIKFYNEFKNADRKDMIEWRINDWILEDASLATAVLSKDKN